MALQPLCNVVVGLTVNAAHSLNKLQMAPEGDAPPVADDLRIRIKVNKADNTFTIIGSGAGMTNQGLDDIVRNGQQNISRGIGVTFYTASLVVRKVAVRTKHNNGYQHKCESMEDGSFHISRDDNAEQLHRGTEITLFLYENQLEFLEEEVIKDLVRKECGSIGYPISLKVEKEPELNEGEIQEVPEWQVIHKPNALGLDNNPLVADNNMEIEPGPKDPNVILCMVAKAHLGGKVDDAIMAEPRSLMADMPCRIKDRILEMNPNNEKVNKLIKMVERGDPIELAVELPYNIAIILNKPKKSVWKRMIERLGTCAITQVAAAAFGALVSALDGDGDAIPF